jgi:AhpD family alkylhydroperoxidase
MTEARLPWIKLAPKAYQAMVAVNADSSIDEGLAELVQTRVSQINGCAFCLDMHARDLRKHGETWQRINSLSTWRETGLYSERERVALAWAETLTRLAGEHGDHDAAFSALSAHFTDKEIVELSWWIARINAWNRMAVGMRQSISAAPIE